MLRSASILTIAVFALVCLRVSGAADANPASAVPPLEDLEDVVVIGLQPDRAAIIRERMVQAAQLLKDVPLQYYYVRRVGRETLRGRPVLFAGWSDIDQRWHVVEIEVPFPAPRWRPGGKPIAFKVLTPGYEAEHVRGTGAERLTFNVFYNSERLRVYGRSYPVIETRLVRTQGARKAVDVANVVHYLPTNEDTAPYFVNEGRTLLRHSAEAALRELRQRAVPSFAFPERLLADTILPETLISLAVIEQTDDYEYRQDAGRAFSNTLGQYGVMQLRAFSYSVSVANAVGPMQFTDRRGRGTYTMITRRCAAAGLDPDFDLGARDLHNAMKAAACLLDLELTQMPAEVREAYLGNAAAVSLFQIAAYNGGPRNATRLLSAVRKLKTTVSDLRLPAVDAVATTRCPCLWVERDGTVTSVTLPTYNRENIGYVDKYQRAMSLLAPPPAAITAR